MGDLPVDSETEGGDAARPGDRPPVHLRPAVWGVVWFGGALGTGARYLLSGAVPHLLRVPVATVGINVLGAFALGVLLEALTRRGPDEGGRRLLRLLLGTGFLGGFTTYSALAMDTVSLARGGLVGHAFGYATTTVVVGGLASLAGMTLARHRRGPVS
jgi:CrcB protein